tara:strand:+ start:1001 stop:2341 length:1341 start_codon:yes stop_codon:yes gene_type:complete
MSKPLLLFQAPVTTRSGYGNHSRDLVLSLIKSDKYDVRILPINWGDTPMNALEEGNSNHQLIRDRLLTSLELPKQPDINVQVTVPNEFQPIGKFNIGITAGIETTLCSPEWLEGCNRMNLILVPSEHSKNVFESSTYRKTDDNGNVVEELKLHAPIEVLFEGADTDIYKKTNDIPTTIKEELDKIDTNWNFLYVGHWLKGGLGQDRKDTGMLVKVFLETFKNHKNPPGLIMKTSGATFSIIDKYELLSKVNGIRNTIEDYKTLPKIHILHGDLTDEEMNGLYNHKKVKAHISFTKGEGFGRPLLEASISQKIVIAPQWSGQVDFLNENSVMLPGGVKQVDPSAVWDGVILANSGWFNVNYPYAAKVMRDVHKNYRNYTVRGQKQGLVSAGKFSLKKMDTIFDEILTKYLPKFAESVELKLPKLEKKTPKIKLPKLKKLGEKVNATV